MKNIPLFLIVLLSAALTGCQTTSTPKTDADAPVTAIEGSQEDQLVETFAPAPDDITPAEYLGMLPLKTVSPAITGSEASTPFPLHGSWSAPEAPPTVQRVLRSHTIFPINRTRGNLIFSKGTGVPRISVEDLNDGRIRIWVRVQNDADRDIMVRVQCDPIKGSIPLMEDSVFENVIFKKDVFRDFSFIINGSTDSRFSILIEII